MGRRKNHATYKRYHVNGLTRTENTFGRLPDDEYAAMASSQRATRIVQEGGHNYQKRREAYVRTQGKLASDAIRRED